MVATCRSFFIIKRMQDEQHTQADTPKSSILVVDDNPPFRHLVVAWLREAGYDVLQASDGEDALAVLSTQQADLILLDLQMEPLGGFTFKDMVAGTPLDRIPILLVTADPSSDILMRAARLGFSGVMKKPIDRDRMLNLIAQQLDRRAAKTRPLSAN